MTIPTIPRGGHRAGATPQKERRTGDLTQEWGPLQYSVSVGFEAPVKGLHTAGS